MNKRAALILIIGFAALLAASLAAILFGAARLSPSELLNAVKTGELTVAGRILFYVRLPRLLAAVLAGAGLAVSGVLIQTVLANPLAGPGIIGVNAGAGLAAAVCMALLPRMTVIMPFAAFIGALATVLFVYAIARGAGASRMTLVLSGVAVSSLMTAGINTLTVTHPDIMGGLRDFQNGGFAGVSLNRLLPAATVIIVTIFAALIFAGELDILGLGESTAASLGLNVRFYRFLFLILAAASAGAAVSFGGLIGFVGLIVPHMARFILRGGGSDCNSKRNLVMLSALMGGTFMVLCDTAARTLFAPYELPVGIIVAFLGVPFFLWLLYKTRGGKTGD